MGPRKLAPGRDVAPQAGARGKGRAVSSTARAGCGRGRDGLGCGEWRDPRGSGTGERRERHGRVTGVGPRHRDRENASLPRMLSNRHGHVPDFDPAIGGSKSGARSRASISASESGGSGREVWRSRLLRHRSGLGVASLAQGRNGSPTSSRPCDASLTNPSRPGRLVAATACQGRHETPGTQLGQARAPGPRPLTCAKSAR